MADADRILKLLQERGERGVTTYELRVGSYSANPAQRIAELREDGHEIDAEATYRLDPHGKKRPMTIYRLAGARGSQVEVTVQESASAAPSSGHRSDAGGLADSPADLKVSAVMCVPSENEAQNLGRNKGKGGSGVSAPEPARLFEIDDKQSYYEREAA